MSAITMLPTVLLSLFTSCVFIIERSARNAGLVIFTKSVWLFMN